MLCVKSLCMFIGDDCANVSLVLRDWTKDNLCAFDEVAVSGACNGHDVAGGGFCEGMLASLCES